MQKNTYPKKEHLKSRKAIEYLFTHGQSITSPPYRLIYRTIDAGEGDVPLLMTSAIPKRYIKRAVDRNLLKRRTREAYRTRKQACIDVLQKKKLRAEIVLLYQSGEIADYSQVKNSVNFLLLKLEKTLKNL